MAQKLIKKFKTEREIMDFKKPRQKSKSKFEELDLDETGEEIAMATMAIEVDKNPEEANHTPA